jgi:cytochrome c
MYKTVLLVSLLLATTMVCGQSRKYNLGRTATSQEIQTRDISISPTGEGLPSGQGSAKDGRRLYVAQCASCHGVRGDVRPGNTPGAGDQGTIDRDKNLTTVGSYWPYATTVWDYINRAMPYQQPGSLSPDDVYSITAYVLYLNGIAGENEVLNAKTLPKIVMPNRDGFVPDPRPDTKAAKH